MNEEGIVYVSIKYDWVVIHAMNFLITAKIFNDILKLDVNETSILFIIDKEMYNASFHVYIESCIICIYIIYLYRILWYIEYLGDLIRLNCAL